MDETFGSGGIVLLTAYPESCEFRAVVEQSDGKLVVAGGVQPRDRVTRLLLARYSPDGSLDPGFGVGGMVVTSQANGYHGNTLLQQPDGKLTAVGFTGSPRAQDFALVRYEATGRLDATFGAGGIATTSLAADDLGSQLVLQVRMQHKRDGRVQRPV